MERLVTGLLLAIAVFWAGACAWLQSGAVPDWWLPVSVVAGLALAAFAAARDIEVRPTAQPVPTWANAATWLVIGTATATLLYSALATPSRHWDGAASFDAKVFWLAASPTLQQPFFALEGVFHHSPDYPLLQPLLVAMTERLAPEFGRVVLPFVYLLLCGVIATALQRRGVRPMLRLATVAAVAVTPALLNAHGGAADSGYSDCLMLLATTTVAAGLLNQRILWFAAGIALLVASKPEGGIYAALALLVPFARTDRRTLWIGMATLIAAAMLWSPLRAQLLHQPAAGTPYLLLLAALPARLADAICVALRLRQRGRWLFVLSWPVAGLICAPLVASLLTPWIAADDGALSLYLRRLDNVHAGLANLPAYFAGVFEFGVVRLRLGLTLILPVVIALLAWRRRDAHRTQHAKHAGRNQAVLAFACLGLATTAMPFVLSIEPDIEHHVRSSVVRLLLHWVGPLWLLIACWLEAQLAPNGAQHTNEASSSVANS